MSFSPFYRVNHIFLLKHRNKIVYRCFKGFYCFIYLFIYLLIYLLLSFVLLSSCILIVYNNVYLYENTILLFCIKQLFSRVKKKFNIFVFSYIYIISGSPHSFVSIQVSSWYHFFVCLFIFFPGRFSFLVV